MKVLVCNGL